MLWNRLIDTYNKVKEDRDKLLAAEDAMFQQFRKELEEQNQQWTGSKEENRQADFKIAGYVKAAFKMYETKGKRPDGHFFDF